MASCSAKVCVGLAIAVLFLLAVFYIGRPIYWKLSATLHELRESHQTVQQGISRIVARAQKSVGWVRYEYDSRDTDSQVQAKAAAGTLPILES